MMDRKNFLKKVVFAGVASAVGSRLIGPSPNNSPSSTYDKLIAEVGFNHLPTDPVGTTKQKHMKTIIHTADSRGKANHGWLDSRHTFSFAHYHNPSRMHFGALRVLNDDIVAQGMGFGNHPHDNMEIISIPLEGDLEHKDSMGNTTVIQEGDIQIMSAGTGVTHSEYNKNKDKQVKFLQIWLFPRAKNLAPRYDQLSIKDLQVKNTWSQILSPDEEDQGVWINQDAWFSMGVFEAGATEDYALHKKGHGVYLFVLEGQVTIGEHTLNTRDGMGIWEVNQFGLTANSDARVLLMEVPMYL